MPTKIPGRTVQQDTGCVGLGALTPFTRTFGSKVSVNAVAIHEPAVEVEDVLNGRFTSRAILTDTAVKYADRGGSGVGLRGGVVRIGLQDMQKVRQPRISAEKEGKYARSFERKTARFKSVRSTFHKPCKRMDTSLYPAEIRSGDLLIGDEVLAINIGQWHVVPGHEVAAGRRIRIPLPLIVVVGPGALERARGRSKGQDPIVCMSLLLLTQRKTVNNQSSSLAFAGHCVSSLMKVECVAGAKILKRVLHQVVLWGASGGIALPLQSRQWRDRTTYLSPTAKRLPEADVSRMRARGGEVYTPRFLSQNVNNTSSNYQGCRARQRFRQCSSLPATRRPYQTHPAHINAHADRAVGR
jgi:hypothetical protein